MDQMEFEPEVITLSDEEGEMAEEPTPIPAPIEPEVDLITPLINKHKEEGNQFFMNKNYQMAYNAYTRAIKMGPELKAVALVYGNRSACLIQQKKYDEALRDLDKAKELDPTYSKYYARVIKCKYLKADFAGAKEIIGKVNELGVAIDDDVLANYNEVLDIHSRAKQAYEKGEFREALYHIRLLLENNVNSEQVLVWKAECLAKGGQYKEAHELANSVLFGNQMNIDAFYVRGICLYYEDSIEKALSEFKLVMKLDPDHKKGFDAYQKVNSLTTRKGQATEAFKSRRFQEALDKYTECLAIDPSNRLANAKLHCNRATCLIKLNRHKEAIPDFQEALRLDNKYHKVYLRRAQCYEDMELYEEAVKDYETLCKVEYSRENQAMLQKAKIKLKRSKTVNYYKILGVSQNATPDEIKKAYQTKAKAHHPDRHSSSSEGKKKEEEKLFKQVGEAYSVLSDEKKRYNYDHGHSNDQPDFNPFAGFGQSDFFFSTW